VDKKNKRIIKGIILKGVLALALAKNRLILKDPHSDKHVTILFKVEDGRLSISLHETLEKEDEHKHLGKIVITKPKAFEERFKELFFREIRQYVKPVSLEEIENCLIAVKPPRDLINKYSTYRKRRRIIDVERAMSDRGLRESILLKPRELI